MVLLSTGKGPVGFCTKPPTLNPNSSVASKQTLSVAVLASQSSPSEVATMANLSLLLRVVLACGLRNYCQRYIEIEKIYEKQW